MDKEHLKRLFQLHFRAGEIYSELKAGTSNVVVEWNQHTVSLYVNGAKLAASDITTHDEALRKAALHVAIDETIP